VIANKIAFKVKINCLRLDFERERERSLTFLRLCFGELLSCTSVKSYPRNWRDFIILHEDFSWDKFLKDSLNRPLLHLQNEKTDEEAMWMRMNYRVIQHSLSAHTVWCPKLFSQLKASSKGEFTFLVDTKMGASMSLGNGSQSCIMVLHPKTFLYIHRADSCLLFFSYY